ncbi:MAG: beta-lactamase family protein, partial [Bacteroidales bacterium]|nr:beta-lactamase family protein [Bacteroidales bacterium]
MRKMFKALMGLALVAVLAACNNGPQKYYKSIPEGFEARCQRAIDEWKVPGMAVAVVKDGEVVFLKGFGKAHLGDSLTPAVDVTPQTQFVIASTSKAFTSGLLANVMDEYPEIKWDVPVKEYLPDFKMYDPWVTENFQVREIMSHHSGFNSYALDDLPTWGYDRDDLYRIYSVLQPTYSFRTKYAYNNSMYTIAAKIIEKYTGKSWDDALVERIFTPLEMNNSTTGNLSFYTAPNLAQGYRMKKAEDKDEIVVVPRTDKEDAFAWLSAVAPAGFVISTVEDMANWVKM